MMRSRFAHRLAALVGVVLLASGCGGANDDTAATTLVPTSTASPTTLAPTTTLSDTTLAPTSTASPTTTPEPETTLNTSSDRAFTETEDIAYVTIEGRVLEADIYVPEGEGPWPVVVMFHGNGPGKDDPPTTVVAEAAAAAGMYVFVPDWLKWTAGIKPESFQGFHAAANCAVAFAQPNLDDSVPIVVYGFSAGVGPAYLAAMHPVSEPVPGCVAENPPGPVTGAVFGDGEYFLHSTIFDGAFATDPDSMQATVTELVDSSFWTTETATRFFIWVADGGTAARRFDDPWDETGWLAQRDPDGSIRADLDGLGQLDDGVISFIDQGEFMALRLREGGFEVTLDSFPGGHWVYDKVSELVDYLIAAAAVEAP